jgi:galactose-1-phosphate uridylyltransferase
MSIEYGKQHGVLRWIRNPFTGNVTYFNDIHRKTNSFRHLTRAQNALPASDGSLEPDELDAEMRRVTDTCVFCPGNEAATPPEVLRLAYEDIYSPAELPQGCSADSWAMRVFPNIIPRVPPECTGGKAESYVIVEDARHFRSDATRLTDLMWSGALSEEHYYQVLRTAVEVVRYSFTNQTVTSALIRKHQGRESGASQPHIHMQVLGADRLFPDVEREIDATAREPQLWQEAADLMREFVFDLEAGDGIVSHWSPFGKFSRQFEVISLQDWQPIHTLSEERLRLFASYLHRLLRALGTAPHDLEIHHGDGLPLHAHVNARRYVYANIGGTLNSPVDVAENVIPPIRELVRRFAREDASRPIIRDAAIRSAAQP